MEVIATRQYVYGFPTHSFKNKQILELNEIYDRLKKEATEFINKLTMNRTQMDITKINDKVYISVYQYNEDEFKRKYGEHCVINCLTQNNCYFDELPYIKIRYLCNLLEKDLKHYDMCIRNINENYDELKKNIEDKQIRINAVILKSLILETHEKLYDMLNQYEWRFYY
jgi:hypothetical protein